MIFKHIELKSQSYNNRNRNGIGAGTHSISKPAVLNEVIRFFVNEMVPLKKVESPHLKRLLLGVYCILLGYSFNI